MRPSKHLLKLMRAIPTLPEDGRYGCGLQEAAGLSSLGMLYVAIEEGVNACLLRVERHPGGEDRGFRPRLIVNLTEVGKAVIEREASA